MNEPIDVLMTLPFPDNLLAKLQAVSPRLNFHVMKASKPEEIPSEIWATAEILYTARVIPTPEQAPNLRWIQFHYAGVDHAREAPILRKSGVVATTLSGAAASQLAEYIVMMLLALGHRLPAMFEHQKRSTWPKDRWERFSPLELRVSKVGIVGYGSIGRQVARILQPFGATVLAAKRDAMHPEDHGYSMPGLGDPGGDYIHRLYPAEALRSMAKECDFLVVCVPLTSKTRNLIDEGILAAMRPTSFLVDVSRGGVVDHNALIAALREHKIAGAALDVFPDEPLPAESPLWKFPNVIISPHISGNTPFYDERAADMFIENLSRYLSREPLLNRLDLDLEY